VVNVEIHDFLCPCSTVVEQTQQGIIPPTRWFLDIDMSKNMQHLFLFQVAQYVPGVTLEWHGKNGLAVGNETGIGRGEISEECMDSRQSDVSGSAAILSTASKVFHEFPDKLRGNIFHYEVRAAFPTLLNSKLQQKFQSIPVRQHRIGTQSPL
jgi:hypothetical protein